MIYFWSDTHFNHAKIIDFATRGDANVETMNERLISNWNTIGKRDTIWFLGDFGFHPKSGEGYSLTNIFKALNGIKCLVVGNHDERNPEVLKLPWDRVEKLYTVKDNGMRAEVCHYPLETWKAAAHGALMLHGHSHGTLQRKLPHRFDVGVDCFPAPISFIELWERAKKQTFEVVDHHRGKEEEL